MSRLQKFGKIYLGVSAQPCFIGGCTGGVIGSAYYTHDYVKNERGIFNKFVGGTGGACFGLIAGSLIGYTTILFLPITTPIFIKNNIIDKIKD